MQWNMFRLPAVVIVGTLIFSSGCQFPVFPKLARNTTREKERPLTSHQVADVKLSLAHSLELQGEVESALVAYREAVELDPRRSNGYWRMAIIHDRQGETEESEKLYRKALKLEPKNSDFHCDYGYSLYLQRRWGEAEQSLRKSIELKPKNSRAHNNLGLALAQAEHAEEAFTEFRKAGCDDADAYNNLAFVMTLNKRWNEAREFYAAALDANPDSAIARAGLQDLNSVVTKLEAVPYRSPVAQAGYARFSRERPEKQNSNTTYTVSDQVSGHAALSDTPPDN